jgi:hypothetical protein
MKISVVSDAKRPLRPECPPPGFWAQIPYFLHVGEGLPRQIPEGMILACRFLWPKDLQDCHTGNNRWP